MKQRKTPILVFSLILMVSIAVGPGPPDHAGPGNGGGGGPDCPGNSCSGGNKDKEPPTAQLNQTEDILLRGNTNLLSADIEDNYEINTVYLLTNETGEMQRKNSYNSPKTVMQKQISNLSFQWTNFSVKERTIGWKIFMNDSNGNSQNSSLKKFRVYSKPDIEVDKLYIDNTTELKEGIKTDIVAKISNQGTEPVNSSLLLKRSTNEGSGYILQDKIDRNLSLDIGESRNVSFKWEVDPGPHRFRIEADPGNHSSELNESNNKASSFVEVPSHQIYYGDAKVKVRLASNGNNFFMTESENAAGRIYFSDYDSNYLFSDLKPLADLNDIRDADSALELEGHNDSLANLFDVNGDENIDNFQNIQVGQRNLETPVIDSTSDGSFKTGVLYDSVNDQSYDGSQDLVFVTVLKNNVEGKFGTYDYEIKIPSALKSQTGSSDKISVYTEIE